MEVDGMKRLIIVSMLLLLAVVLMAKPVSMDQALRVAQNWMLEKTGQQFTNSTISPLKPDSPDNYIWVVNLRPQGFVLVAADDASLPVIGYNTTDVWSESSLPPQLRYMIGIWESQLNHIVTNRLQADLNIARQWQNYDVVQESFLPNRDFRDVNPLLSTVWGQGTYYNAQCPSGTPVGCVATAMAQIMKYWSFPTVGSSSHSYSCPPYGTLTANFGTTTYAWSSMPNNVTSTNAAVATISYHAGVAVNMQYAPDGSGAYSTDVAPALTTYFKYASSAHYWDKSSYTEANWLALIKGQLDIAYPVYYSGSGPAGGHAWVVDGYQGNNFHINWGWNGYANGYYALTALNPGGDTFNNGQAAVIGIHPSTSTPALTEGFEGTTFPPTGWGRSASTWTRTTTSFITGTASAYYNGTANNVRLTTPKLSITAASTLSFKAKRATTGRNEIINIQYSTNGTSWTTYYTTAGLTATAATYSCTFNTLTPGDYYLAFNANSSNSNTNTKSIWLDDVVGPYTATAAALNLTSWSAGALSPGDESRSDNIFSLSNLGAGNLTITSVTSLSGTEFSTNFNSAVSLVYGQTADFGFTYDPINYGTDNVSFQIVTNGGTVTIALSGSATYAVFYDGFENYTDFSLTCAPWTQYDVDLLPTYAVTGETWVNSGSAQAWMIFNPSAATPPMNATYPAYNGNKLASCWAAVPSGTNYNNDWLVTPQLTLTSAGTVSFWAKAFSSTYVPETLAIKYSTTTNATSAFTTTLATLSLSSTTWTNYSYAIPQTCKYIAFQCTSQDMFATWIDDVKVTDSTAPPTPTFGTLNGHVYEYGTTTPIANALVTVGTKQCITNAAGYYQITYLLTGSVSASCTAPGMFYHASSVSGIAITNGGTTTQDFGLTWGELAASPTSVSASLYQGELGSSSVTLSNPGGTANTAYAGYFTASLRGTRTPSFVRDIRKPSPDKYGTSIPQITDANGSDRSTSWFSYATIDNANYYSGAMTERGNYFLVSDFALMDGAVTVSQLRGYFYNPSGTGAWTTATHRTFTWKIYSVDSAGTVTLMHTSANQVLPSIATDTYTLNSYTLPTAVTIPAGYDFIVTAVPAGTTDTTYGRPQTLATDVTSNNGLKYDSTNGWVFTGLDYVIDAYVSGTEWLTAYNFSGDIVPNGNVVMPITFNTVGVTAGTKNAYMYVYNDANYTAPNGGNRGDALVVPISLTVTVATTPVAVITSGTSWTTSTNVGTPSSSGDVFTLKNIGPGNLTITSISGLSGTPFTTNFSTGTVLAQNATYNFGFTFTPTVTGIYNATFTIVTNGGTKTITLKGYSNYIYESFEGTTFPPAGWQSVDNDSDTYNWYQYTVSGSTVAHTGTYCAGSASYVNAAKNAVNELRIEAGRPALTPDNWLITPRLAVPTGGLISFWIGAQDPAWPAEHYSVKISTTNNAIASFTTTLLTETLADGDWHYKEINLSAYAGQNVYIAFQHHACTDQFVLKLDDIYMPPLAAPLTYGNLSGRVRLAGTTTGVVGATVNVASQTATTIEDGVYSFTGLVVDTYQMTVTAAGCQNYISNVTLLTNQTVSHDVYLDYSQFASPQTSYTLNCEIGNTTSASTSIQNTGNFPVAWTANAGVWGGNTYLQGAMNQTWEDYVMTGWTGSVGPNTDIYGTTSTPYGYNSLRTWVFASYGTTSTQYIITPRLHVQAADVLSFWYREFNASDETFNVLVSTTDNSIGSFTNLATVGPLADNSWYQFSHALSAYAGTDIYIAFQYPRIDGYQYGYIMLDDITGPQQYLPGMNWLSVDPTSGTLAASGSTPVALNATAAILPVGTYTAQAWFFGTAVNEPYKLYVTLNVTAPAGVEPPQNPVTETYPTYGALAWDAVDNANSYHIYVSDDPYGTYQLLSTTADTYAEIPWGDVIALGFPGGDAKIFFRVTADTAARSSVQLTSVTKTNSSQSLDKLLDPNKTRVLFMSE
jgi:hypothetical protein